MKENIEEIVNEIKEDDLRKFISKNLKTNTDLLDKFRIEFNTYFPARAKKEYESRLYNSISSCCDRYGFIDYYHTSNYETVMYKYIEEARELVNKKNYDEAFTLIDVILNSIPKTEIDDSDGSTDMIASSCIEIIQDILDLVDKDDKVLKEILEFIIKDVKELNLYNYGVDLSELLKYFIDNKIYLEEIKIDLEKALEKSKEKSYFYNRKKYIGYLLEIYEILNEQNKVMELLKEYSFDQKVCMRYADELIKGGKMKESIDALKNNFKDSYHGNQECVEKLSKIYLDNEMTEEYKELLFDDFYKYSRYDIKVYCKLKELYSDTEWKLEREKIINNLKKEKYNDIKLNEIYIEEKMFDELFENVKNKYMKDIICYEKYLLPKYKNQILDIYANCCLNDARISNTRTSYRNVAISVNHLEQIDRDMFKKVLVDIASTYFRNRPAMKDEFNRVIKNMDSYIN